LLLVAALAGCERTTLERHPMPGASAARGQALIGEVGCASCHAIPGVKWPKGRVGPSLKGFADAGLIAGRFPNEPAALALWVRNAQALAPGSGMPPMPLTEPEARDVAAYLYTLDAR